MTTSEIVLQRALTLARESTENEAAVADLLDSSGGRRVSLVLARQQLLDREDDPAAAQAVALIDEAIGRLPAF